MWSKQCFEPLNSLVRDEADGWCQTHVAGLLLMKNEASLRAPMLSSQAVYEPRAARDRRKTGDESHVTTLTTEDFFTITLRHKESLSEANMCAKVLVTLPVAAVFNTILDWAVRTRTHMNAA